jgi:NADPH:quinone reductase-like Zn-dependent oxidoreductase
MELPQPSGDQVLVRVRAASLNRSDWEGLTGKPLYARIAGVFRPRRPVLGTDVAGTIEAVGPDHTEFKTGDHVFGELQGTGGGFAEYACGRGTLILKPAAMPFDVAAALPQAATIALRGICDKGMVKHGQRVLINGAGGGAGTFAIQLARGAGAHVTGVDNAGKLEFMRGMGAEEVIDYTREDFTKGGRRYDLLLDLVAHRGIFAYNRALKAGGRYLFVGGSAWVILQLLLLGRVVGRRAGKRLQMLVALSTKDDLERAAALWARSELAVHIEKRYRLEEVPEALRALGAGELRGKAVVLNDD